MDEQARDYFVSICCGHSSHAPKVAHIKTLTLRGSLHGNDEWAVDTPYLDRLEGFGDRKSRNARGKEAILQQRIDDDLGGMGVYLDGNELASDYAVAERKRYKFPCPLCRQTVEVTAERLHPKLWELVELATPVEIGEKFRGVQYLAGAPYLYTLDLSELAAKLSI